MIYFFVERELVRALVRLHALYWSERSHSRRIAGGFPKLAILREAEPVILALRFQTRLLQGRCSQGEETLWFRHWQRPEHRGIDDGVDRCVRADGQPKRQYGRRGEDRTSD